MNRSDLNELLAEGLHRPFTDAEQARLRAWLESHPENRDDTELDLALNRALRSLPPPLPSSNFTARVLAAVRHSEPERVRGWTDWLALPSLKWAWRTALAGAVCAFGLLTYQQHQTALLLERAESVVTLSESLPNIELLKDFNAIKELRPAQVETEADTLVAALQ